MGKRWYEKVGTLTLNDKVDITDPCYDKDVWYRHTSECAPGEYTGYVEMTDEGDWGKRVAAIIITRNDKPFEVARMEYIANIGVDAGMAGFFRDKPDYPDDEWMKFLVESGVFKTNEEFDYSKHAYEIPYGIFSSSGYGDGGYDVYATKERDIFKIVFIPNEDEEDEYDYEDDIDEDDEY